MSDDTKLIDLSAYRDMDVKTVRMRCLNGDDLVASAGRCAPADGGTLDPTIFSIQLRQQQIAQSIVEVNGEQVRGPCLASLHWSARTREFCAMGYDYLNGLTSDEREGFMKALTSGVGATSIQPVARVAG